MPLMHRFVRQHGLANEIADGEDVCNVRAHLCIDGNESTLANGNSCRLGANALAIGHATNGLQDEVIQLGLSRRFSTLKAHADALRCCLRSHRFRVEKDAVKTRRIHLLPNLDQIAVGALHQAVLHFHHVQPRAKGGVHRAHLQPDDAAANDEHALWLLA